MENPHIFGIRSTVSINSSFGVRKCGVCSWPLSTETWFGKIKNERVGHKEPLIPGWPRGHPGSGGEAVQAKLLTVKISNSQGVGLLNAYEIQTVRKTQNTQCLSYCYL